MWFEFCGEDVEGRCDDGEADAEKARRDEKNGERGAARREGCRARDCHHRNCIGREADQQRRARSQSPADRRAAERKRDGEQRLRNEQRSVLGFGKAGSAYARERRADCGNDDEREPLHERRRTNEQQATRRRAHVPRGVRRHSGSLGLQRYT